MALHGPARPERPREKDGGWHKYTPVRHDCAFRTIVTLKHNPPQEFEEPASSGGGLSASGELSTGADASVRAGAHLFRLFVGWVPKQFTEADLKPLFDQVRA